MLGIDVDAYLRTTQPYLTSRQLRAMATSGFTIGSHGLDHSPLQGQVEGDVRRQVIESTRQICDLVATRSAPFALPFGSDGLDLSELTSLVNDLDEVDMICDCTGVRALPAGLFNRVGVDTRQTRSTQRSSVPANVLRSTVSACLAARRSG